MLYYVPTRGIAKAFKIANGVVKTRPKSQTISAFAYPGATPSISSNDGHAGILWLLDRSTDQLRAYDARDLQRLLYAGSVAPTRGEPLGFVVKFTVPTVANGMVYVGTADALIGYGPLPHRARGRVSA
jgi:hypothetical protein